METFLKLLGSQGQEAQGCVCVLGVRRVCGWQLALSTTLQFPHLEVEDPCVVLGETLIMGYDSEKQALIQGQASNSCEKPAVPCRQAQGRGHLQERERPDSS